VIAKPNTPEQSVISPIPVGPISVDMCALNDTEIARKIMEAPDKTRAFIKYFFALLIFTTPKKANDTKIYVF
jgi:hypothetical protein